MKIKVFCTILMVSLLTFVACTDNVELSEPCANKLANTDKNANARDAGDKLMEYFAGGDTRALSDSEYPDYYGGGYINNEGKLVIFIKGDVDKQKMMLTKFVSSESIEYVSGEYSYKELKEIIANIDNFKINYPDNNVSKNVQMVALDDINNSITVRLVDLDDNKIAEFKNNIMDSPAIKFEKSKGIHILNALHPGNDIWTRYNNYLYPNSVGYAANRWGNTGYITAGHGFATGETVYTRNNQAIGRCEISVRSGSVDAAFIMPTNFNYGADNYMDDGNLVGERTTIWANDQVIKRGQTIYKSSGRILNTSVSTETRNPITGEIRYYTDLAESDYLSAGGDSGGTVYMNVGGNYVIGIHQSSNSFTSNFCKVGNIRSALQAYFW